MCLSLNYPFTQTNFVKSHEKSHETENTSHCRSNPVITFEILWYYFYLGPIGTGKPMTQGFWPKWT